LSRGKQYFFLTRFTINIQANQGARTYNPTDIHGSHRFSDISELFDIPLEILCRTFALPEDVDPATFQNLDFETIYPEFEGE